MLSLPDTPADLPKAAGAAPADLPKEPTPQVATLIFKNSANDVLLLSETLIFNPTSLEIPLPAGKGGITDVTVNGQPAQYIEGAWTPSGWVSTGQHQLHWQSDNVLFDLTSSTLGMKDLVTIAESAQ